MKIKLMYLNDNFIQQFIKNVKKNFKKVKQVKHKNANQEQLTKL